MRFSRAVNRKMRVYDGENWKIYDQKTRSIRGRSVRDGFLKIFSKTSRVDPVAANASPSFTTKAASYGFHSSRCLATLRQFITKPIPGEVVRSGVSAAVPAGPADPGQLSDRKPADPQPPA